MRAISSEEFTYWIEMYRREPWGERMADLRMGTLASLFANLHRDTKRKKEPFVPSDFAPWSLEPDREEATGPILLKDKAAQSNMIRSSLFGRRLRKANVK
ncbi:hypothetical protein QFZ94_004805 [Paraburkholderia sp. JPY465]|uniref:phage tail assembly protein T n=1 Tax=Paraburkholderia sp. JPY465 TaxID=3042285 RepID=UPI003D198392